MSANEGLMDPVTCDEAQLTVGEAVAQRVRDIMLASPSTLPGNATIADARAFFADPKKVNAVLVDGTAFAGVLQRGDLPALVPDDAPVRGYARTDVPTVRPDQPASEAIDILDSRGLARLIVLDDDGVTLAGLLCLDLKRSGFCRG